jgi:AcrR family transcriptional regulator
VSLIDVAKEIGITKGGIYHYFESKEQLFHAGISYLYDHFGEKYARIFSEEKTFRGILNFLLSEEQDDSLKRLLNVEQGDYRANDASLALEIIHNFPELQQRIDQGQLELRNIIKEKLQLAQKTGETRRDFDPQVVATMILSVSSGLNILGKQINTSAMHQQLIDSIWQFIGVNDNKE